MELHTLVATQALKCRSLAQARQQHASFFIAEAHYLGQIPARLMSWADPDMRLI